jgi:hypothetical protein
MVVTARAKEPLVVLTGTSTIVSELFLEDVVDGHHAVLLSPLAFCSLCRRFHAAFSFALVAAETL